MNDPGVSLSEGRAEPEFPVAGGEMGALIRAFDWGRTGLGPASAWPLSLRTAVGIILSSRYAMFIWWGRDLINVYNDAYASIMGNKHPASLGLSARDVWAEIWDQISPRAEAVLSHGRSTFDESLLLIVERNGYPEEAYFTFSYSPVQDDHGDVGGIFCAVTDETSRVIGERRLRLLREVAAMAPDAHTPDAVCAGATGCMTSDAPDIPFALLYLTDGPRACLAGRVGIGADHPAAPAVIDLHDAAAVWSLAQVEGRADPLIVEDLQARFPDLPTGGWDRAASRAVMVSISKGGQSGTAGFLVIGLNPYLVFDDDYHGFVGLLADQIASGIANAEAYVEERRRAEALAEIDRAKTLFFSNVSHEFRTPLTLMLGPLEDMLRDTLAPQQRERLELAYRNSQRLLKLVNMLLDFSRIEAGRVQASYQPTDLSALTADLASGFHSAVERAGIVLKIDCRALGRPVYVDHDMWEKVVLNLLSNAFKFTFEGHIDVTLRAAGDHAVLTVRDTGVGIPAHELPSVFERFHRIEGQRTRSFEGSGIGLALVQELVRLHGGRIGVQSEVDRGSTFTVSVPFGVAHLPPDRIGASLDPAPTPLRIEAFVEEALRWLPDVAPSEMDGPEPAEHQTGTDPEWPTVLLADDNADIRSYVRRLLGRRYNVTTVANGKAALDAVRRLRPDLVLTDVMMPVLDGFGLLRAIRGNSALQDLPVVLLSARAAEEARVEGLEAGADDYLTKPFTARELVARVGANLALGRLRREATQTAVENAERLRQMFDQAPGFMCLLRGPDFVYELANAAYMQLIGYRDVMGKPLHEALPEVRDQGYIELLQSVYRSGDSFIGKSAKLTLRRVSTDPPEDVFLDFVYQPIKNRNGQVTGIFVEGSDVTKRVRAETALREINEQLEVHVAARTAELQEALTKLHDEIQERERAEAALRQSQKMEAVGQLTGGVAHDFNNLLTAISGGAETLDRHLPRDLGPSDARVRRALRMVQEGSRRAATLTHRLLAFARRQALDPHPLDANRLVAGMLELLHRTLGESITIDVVAAPNLWRTLADPNQLESALLNLAVNARDAMPDGGTLTIETANTVLDHAYAAENQDVVPGQYVMIAVADTGTGMTTETVDHVFEPFFTTKQSGQGTGLGLSQVYGFIKQSNGHIKIYSEPERGTVVKLYLPRLAADVVAEPDDVSVVAASVAGSGELILVVEDDDTVRSHSTDSLREMGYVVLEAPDGRTGLDLLTRHPDIRLLFTDVGLPGGMTGPQLADQSRRLRPDLKVLFTTAYARKAIGDDGTFDPGTHLLPKPFTYADLGAKVRSLLSE